MTVRERRLWIGAAALLVLIYSTLYLVRVPIEYLRSRGLLSAVVAAVFVAVALAIVTVLWRRRPGPRELAVWGLFALLTVWALAVTGRPEERLHLIEYGALGALVYAALAERREVGLPTALATALGVGLCGWLDEGIQYLLPNRYYDLRDVLLNFAAALLAVGAMHGAFLARRSDRAAG